MDEQARSEELRRLGLIPTAQRLAILGYLEKYLTHPTAEDVFCAVRDRFPSLSRATVYNSLNALKRVGSILELTIDRAAARYDARALPHPHFLCRECGTLYDVDLPCPVRPGDLVLGHKVEVAHIYLHGVCEDCRNGGRQ
jgi:Fur family peroxide stress response transcriptional regulator